MTKPMLTLNGVVTNVFESPVGVNKQTGEQYGGKDKVQILGDVQLENGACRKDLITLTTNQGQKLKTLIGKSITFPVGMIATGKGQLHYFIPRSAQFATNA